MDLDRQAYPVVKQTLEEIFTGGYQEAAICWGIGSGKSFLAAVAICYLVHRTLCLRNPQAAYGLAPGSSIAFMNMGLNAQQARQVVFGEIRQRIENSPWFRGRFKPDPRVRTELRFPKGVVVIPGNSAETFPLGYNLLGAVLDEASWYVDAELGRDVAEEIYTALQRRIRSRFRDAGLLVMISSPRYVDDFIQRKLRDAEEDPTIYASRRAIWEVKPDGFFRGPTFEFRGMQVPVELEPDFRRNPDKALRDLAAVPSLTVQRFFPEPALVERCCGSGGASPTDETGALKPWFRPEDSAPRFIHVDLGLTRDACGIAMAHVEHPRGPGGADIAVVDLMLRIRPRAGEEIQFSTVRELIYELADRGFQIAQVSYDGWQSVDSRQILRRRGFNTKIVSADRDCSAYETLRALVNEQRLRAYWYEPFIQECRRLELVKGTRVDHPPGGSKDVADAVAVAVSEALRADSGPVRAHIV